VKTWRPDDGEGSDPMWGGFFSRRGDIIASIAAVAFIVGVWVLFGGGWGASMALVVFIVWGWMHG
jgi:hypothetical protein